MPHAPNTSAAAAALALLVVVASSPGCAGSGPAGATDGPIPPPPPPVVIGAASQQPASGPPPCPPSSWRDDSSGDCLSLDCGAIEGHTWRRRFSAEGPGAEARRILVAPDGTIVVAASLSGKLLLRTRPPSKPSDVVPGQGLSDVLVAKLDPTGQALWGRSYGGSGQHYASDLAIDREGNLLVTGELNSPMSYGGPTLHHAGETDIHFAKLDAAGRHLWSKSFGNPKTNYAPRVATLSTGRIVLTGFFYGALDVGGGPIPSNDGNTFVAVYEPDGRLVWSLGVGGSGPWVQAVVVDHEDHIILYGDFARPLQLQPTPQLRPVGLRDIFLAKLDDGGRALWSKRFGKVPTASQYPQGLAIDREGAILISGRFEGAVGFGGIPLKTAPRRPRLFVAKLGPDGSHRWSKTVGTAEQYGEARLLVATDGLGRAYLAGFGAQTVDFGGGRLTAIPPMGAGYSGPAPMARRRSYVALLGPDGAHLSSMLYGSPGDELQALAVDGCNHGLVAGANEWSAPNHLFVGRLP
ncbi:MAG: hypothetical protein JRI68_27155 [Deltaproteobacteria bacterium]|nr:hypothetical protein [Deltaproteobacteria bacterium]